MSAFSVAEAEAFRRRRNDFSPDRTATVSTRALSLLRVATNAAATPQEREMRLRPSPVGNSRGWSCCPSGPERRSSAESPVSSTVRRRLSVSRDLCSSVVWWLLVGPGSDLSEESACGVQLAALDDRAAPECPPGPASSLFASRRSCR